MDTVGKAVYGMGFLSIIAGLSLTVVSYFHETHVHLAFFLSTGITMIVSNWLRQSNRVLPKNEEQSESRISKNMGYIILGGFIFVGLAIIGIPVATVLVALAKDESETVGEMVQTVIGTISSIGDEAGATYYAFLLGVLYFLSTKTAPANT